MTDTAHARLMAEEIPARPAPHVRQPWTPEEQARHRTELLAALDEHTAAARRHLTAVPDTHTHAA
ncbi:hypothetical protein ABZ820_34810 [Streptomyces diacarni]|uniref:hypothetical protein n=1 Tax=Streptomyces diacarni TaxID=2800381 RepID=UPI0033FFD7A6